MRDKARMMDQLTELNNNLQNTDREADFFLIEIERRDAEIKTMDNYQKKYLKEVDSIKSKDQILNGQIKQLQASLIHMSNYIQKLTLEYKTQMMHVCTELEQEQQKRFNLEQQLAMTMSLQDASNSSTAHNYTSEMSNLLLENSSNTEKYEHVLSHKGHDTSIQCVCFGSDPNIIASSDESGCVNIWKFSEENPELYNVESLQVSSQCITSICFSDDCSKILTCSKDGVVRIIGARKAFSSLKGHTSHITCAIFVNSDNQVFSGSKDKTMKLWDVIQQKCIKTFLPGSCCNSMQNITDSLVISGHFDKTLKYHDWRQQQKVWETQTDHTEPIVSVSISYDRNFILTNSRDNTLKIFDLRMNKEIPPHQTLKDPQYFCSTENLTRAHFKPFSSTIVAVPSCVNSFTENSANGIFIFNLSNTSTANQVLLHQCRVNDISFSPNGSAIVAACTSGNLEIYKQTSM
ncbi:hypothetical protein C9374_001234 [Naegleria lovaniensis]|uniref:Guanine nucleotide-binding protein subunit beta-like protein n=1 Tax=Naegleria lovaniensis TaxID=51637 RepID=A0AA88KL97_NAELO|nr:uncharacterized protein C9374_001234 [Naegleria lovaniensis]KAG2387640.1 hypothetical protein C9374_001234 [Naegleria lovaniensis]